MFRSSVLTPLLLSAAAALPAQDIPGFCNSYPQSVGAGQWQSWDDNDNATDNDEWELRSPGGGYYRVINRHRGQVLNVTGASTVNTGNVDQWSWANANQQQFQLISIP